MRDLYKLAGLLCVVTFLSACSGDSFVSSAATSSTPGSGSNGNSPGCTDPTLPSCIVNANFISLSVSAQQIKSDGSDTAKVIATVLDEDHAAIKNAQIKFSAPAGKLSSSVVFSDVNGIASVDFSAGTADPSNQIVTITATVTGVGTTSIPVEIIGTTLEVTVDNTSLQIPVGSTTVQQSVKVTAKDAGGKRIFKAPLTFTVATTGTATTSLSSAQATTDTRGEVVLTLTAGGTGTASLVARGLGTTATTAFTVADIAVDNPFRITGTTPQLNGAVKTNPYPLVANGSAVAIAVAAQGITTVRFSSTIGTWLVGGLSYVDVAVVGGTASATLQSNAGNHGFATVIVSDAANPKTYDSIVVAMSPIDTAAALITLQSDLNALKPTLPVSTSAVTYQAAIEATVRTNNASGNYPVFNVPVVFTLANSTGGGETLTTAYATTDLNGIVKTTLKSGTLPSGASGVTVTATALVGTASPTSMGIVIGGTGGSVAVGRATKIILDKDNTAIYKMPMSVDVADSNGNAVGANVTLSLWPSYYRTGVWYDTDPDSKTVDWKPWVTGTIQNEDIDEDLIWDRPPAAATDEDVNLDGALTPHNSTGGTLPITVATNSAGIGYYELTFLKEYSVWIVDRVRASTKVQGTETTGTLEFGLDYELEEGKGGFLHDSPWPLVLSGAPGTLAHELSAPVAVPYTVVALDSDLAKSSVTPSRGSVVQIFVNTVAQAAFNYRIDAGELPGTVYDASIQLRQKPTCSGGIGATCNDIVIRYPIRVFVQ